MRPTILLASGGLDSFAASILNPQAVPVFVQNSARYNALDFEAACKLYGPSLILVMQVGWHREYPDGYVPQRNLLLASTVLGEFPTAEALLFSAPRGDTVADSSPAFFAALQEVMRSSLGRRKNQVRVLNAARRYTKAQLLRVVLHNRPTLYRHVRSCYSAEHHACGTCAACVRSYIAERCNGVSKWYASDPREAMRRMRNGLTWRDAWRAGLRASLEAWRASR